MLKKSNLVGFSSIAFWSANVHSWRQHLLYIQTINLETQCECRLPFAYFWVFETSSKVNIWLAGHYIVSLDSLCVNRQIHTGCLWTVFLLALKTFLGTAGIKETWFLRSLVLIKRTVNDCLRDLNRAQQSDCCNTFIWGLMQLICVCLNVRKIVYETQRNVHCFKFYKCT